MSELNCDRRLDRANGCFLSVRTSLEMRTRPIGLPPDPPTKGSRVIRWQEPDVDDYIRTFRSVGDPWLWYGRLRAPERELRAVLASDAHEIWRLWVDDSVAGFCELNRGSPGEVEIAYFGLFPEYVGQGLAGYFIRAMLHEAWRGNTHRVWLHTCTEDHPKAIEFYRYIGFVEFDRVEEWIRDPRLDGLLPRDAGPHVAIPE